MTEPIIDGAGKGDANPKMWKLKISGVEKEYPESEVMERAQKDLHYTQEMQTLRKKEESLGADAETRAQKLFEDWLVEAAKDNPTANDESKNKDKAGDSSSQSPEANKQIEALQKEMQDLKGAHKTSSEEQVRKEIESHLDGLQTKYPKMNRILIKERFMREAKETDVPAQAFEQYAKEAQEQYNKDKQATIDAYIKEKETVPGESGEGGGAGGVGGDEKKKEVPKDMDAAREATEKLFVANRGRVPLV